MNFQKMMQQAQQMQFKMQEMQEKLGDIEVEGEAGGGLVKARLTCKGELLGLDVDAGIISADDKETMEDLIVAAVNNANAAKDERVKSETEAMMKELGLPAGAQIPGM
ncbi:MAG: YbaB/EbfC family nucleoid-associated protein [Micavibrio sp.]|nr:YbaB/EbfC family nucleoid-associated protein [Micavibrio sp.]